MYRPRVSEWSVGIGVESLEVLNDKDFAIHSDDGAKLLVSFSQENDEIISNLKAVQGSKALREGEGELEYIDLRFGNRVYYKFD